MIFDDETREDNSSVIESAQVFSPVFADQVSYADLREAAASPGYKSLIHRADERPEAQ